MHISYQFPIFCSLEINWQLFILDLNKLKKKIILLYFININILFKFMTLKCVMAMKKILIYEQYIDIIIF